MQKKHHCGNFTMQRCFFLEITAIKSIITPNNAALIKNKNKIDSVAGFSLPLFMS